MDNLRIVFDDAGQCRAQRAVLSAFAASLDAGVEIAWSSGLSGLKAWPDVPPESSRRLAVRMAALSPMVGRRTLLIPGHAVPGERLPQLAEGGTEPVSAFATVADLDLFVADNGTMQAAHYARHCALSPDYQSCSAYAADGLASIPAGLPQQGWRSALIFTERPWYVAQVAARRQWLLWLQRAFKQGLITTADVDADIDEGLARPSLREDARAMAAGALYPRAPDMTLDALFAYPEAKLTGAQRSMLHSAALHERTLRFSRLEAVRKMAEAAAAGASQPQGTGEPFGVRLLRRTRNLGRRAYKRAYQIYSITLRPLVRDSAAPEAGSQ